MLSVVTSVSSKEAANFAECWFILVPLRRSQACHTGLELYRQYRAAIPRIDAGPCGAGAGLYSPPMSARVKRDELDRIARSYSLDATAVESLLDAADARPSRADRQDFLAGCARHGGVLSLAAGIVFFVAANWGRMAVFGRFALLELLFVAVLGIGLFKPPPRFVGRAALFLSFIITGALLALFGQTYQTGADVYELFLTWALLGLPFAIAAQWGVASAAWIIVLDTALLLFCGWQPRGGLLWVVFDGGRLNATHAILMAAFLNLALWFAFEKVEVRAVPDWVRRVALTCGMMFVTWAGVLGVTGNDFGGSSSSTRAIAFVGAILALAAVTWIALRWRRDVYPLAVAFASFVILGMVLIAEAVDTPDEASLFIMAFWLIATSTIGGRMLVKLMRQWRVETA